MQRFFFIFLLSILLAACGLAPASPTATSTPQPTATFTPTLRPTVTPTVTEIPFNVPAVWKEILGDGFKVLGDGRVRDERTGNIIDGLRMNNKEQLQMFYEFEGNKNFGVTFEPKWDVKVTDEGDLDLPGCIWDGEKMVRQYFSIADGATGLNIEGLGEPVLSVAEIQAILANKDNVDMSDKAREKTESNEKRLLQCLVKKMDYCADEGFIKRLSGSKDWVDFDKASIRSNKVPKRGSDGKYSYYDTTFYTSGGLGGEVELSWVAYWDNEGKARIVLLDIDDLVPDDDEPGCELGKGKCLWSRERWSPINEPTELLR